jgi:hypothetical protein
MYVLRHRRLSLLEGKLPFRHLANPIVRFIHVCLEGDDGRLYGSNHGVEPVDIGVHVRSNFLRFGVLQLYAGLQWSFDVELHSLDVGLKIVLGLRSHSFRNGDFCIVEKRHHLTFGGSFCQLPPHLVNPLVGVGRVGLVLRVLLAGLLFDGAVDVFH